MPIVWRRSTLQHFQDSVPGRVYAGLRRCMQARSHPEHAVAKRGHNRLFFFWSEKKGVRPHPPNPLATCLSHWGTVHVLSSMQMLEFGLRGCLNFFGQGCTYMKFSVSQPSVRLERDTIWHEVNFGTQHVKTFKLCPLPPPPPPSPIATHWAVSWERVLNSPAAYWHTRVQMLNFKWKIATPMVRKWA